MNKRRDLAARFVIFIAAGFAAGPGVSAVFEVNRGVPVWFGTLAILGSSVLVLALFRNRRWFPPDPSEYKFSAVLQQKDRVR